MTLDKFLREFDFIQRLQPSRNSSADPTRYAVRKHGASAWSIAEVWIVGPIEDGLRHVTIWSNDEFNSPETIQSYLDEHHSEKAYSGRDESEWMARR